MRVCFISLEYFGWGKYGGIGKATRDIASGLVQRGVDVSVVVPLGVDQRNIESVDGVDVYGFPLSGYPFIGRIFRRINANIYHSQDPTLGTWIAKNSCTEAIHLLTCQNPKSSEDWKKVNKFYPTRRLIYNQLIEPHITKSIKKLDHVYCHARYTIEKTRRLFDLPYEPSYLPNPVFVPNNLPLKSSVPTILFLGRFDGEKNPEGFLRLAEKFPEIKFIAAGSTRNLSLDQRLRRRYAGVGNLSMPGFLDGMDKERVLNASWVLVNTSVSECLPVSFLEAAAHGCSILSPHDPDGFASMFGLHVSHMGLRDGLAWLLEDERWKKRAARGYEYVRENHELTKVVQLHLDEYRKWMG